VRLKKTLKKGAGIKKLGVVVQPNVGQKKNQNQGENSCSRRGRDAVLGKKGKTGHPEPKERQGGGQRPYNGLK